MPDLSQRSSHVAPTPEKFQETAMVTDLEHASACESVRHLVSWVLASTQEPYLPWLATASLGQLHDAIALTAAQLEHDRAALTRLASPECAAALPTPDALDRVLRALGLPLTVEDLEPTLPHIALSRRAALAAFTADPTLHAAALGWLTASQALLGARRFPTAEAIRAHGFGADTAASWEAQFEPATSMPCLQVTELILRERPSLAPMTLAGAQLAVASAAEIERQLTLAWQGGRRLLTWPGPVTSETPGIVDDATEADHERAST